ncbi:MAG: imidazole glycerol phosphate synthase subunit HisF [Elusimicrobia bacterium CG_4_9_14_3_um_filter_62_55]|nr:MAG: imidazole glycerol phosphate synthase subunit HisF [Elusimicrobia bacterium CG22_combo_CG10-13_8_21_14_all_63_91]PJA14576.1 MAG: imidazole glycerol phosphate synthase subunit HisF [Elusimicrobia bacterium CG_4_10_14_0_2_um_filter_63_34]PJB26842.1 MAG: imidazole glycerol phosphate synthase subunit HisF [Elusimicrobia bacterium CG_4_9_14_3_um_filter_62_55]
MLSRRIIPCLDVLGGRVVKGVRFRGHEDLGAVGDFAARYRLQGADELVLYDIAASAEGRSADRAWVREAAKQLDIPFCVAGGIRSVEDARAVLGEGTDKISINSPALERPGLIDELVSAFGQQCVVIGVDSRKVEGEFRTYLYTGSEAKTRESGRATTAWLKEVQERGAGEIVLNCMDQDGTGDGYDLEQLRAARAVVSVPLVASGGAKRVEDFERVFKESDADAALAAGVFHRGELTVGQVKQYLAERGVEVRR